MTDTVSAPSRRRIAGTIAGREAKVALRGIGGYVALSAALAAGAFIHLIDVRALDAAGVLVLADPFGPALTIAVMVLALFLAVSAAVSVARDRESGTLETLFYGPVDEPAYILGKVGGLILAYAAALPLLLACLGLLGLMSGFALTAKIPLGLVLSIVPAAEIVGFGVLLAIGTSRVRTAILLLVAVIAVVFGTAVVYRVVLLIEIDDPASPVLPLRDALAAVDMGIRWLSPFAALERVIDGVAKSAWRSAGGSLALAVVYAGAMIALAALWLRRRGVERKGE